VPFEQFCQGLGIDIRPQRSLLPRREWDGIDLVIFGTENNAAMVAFEMKVDDHEHMTALVKGGKRDWQTVLYPELLPKCPHLLFVTLGIGEFYQRPCGDRFRWVRLDDFHRALQSIRHSNQVITDWKEAVASEMDLRQRVLMNDRTRIDEYRAGVWNVTLLNDLRERLRETPGGAALCEGARIYLHGQGPDTILNFGIRGPSGRFFMEINCGGKLSLKAHLAWLTSQADREQYVARAVTFWQELFHKTEHTPRRALRRRVGKTQTLLDFDIGIRWPDNRGFQYEVSAADTARRTSALLEVFLKSVKSEPLA
jgi:hypothetical protein